MSSVAEVQLHSTPATLTLPDREGNNKKYKLQSVIRTFLKFLENRILAIPVPASTAMFWLHSKDFLENHRYMFWLHVTI